MSAAHSPTELALRRDLVAVRHAEVRHPVQRRAAHQQLRRLSGEAARPGSTACRSQTSGDTGRLSKVTVVSARPHTYLLVRRRLLRADGSRDPVFLITASEGSASMKIKRLLIMATATLSFSSLAIHSAGQKGEDKVTADSVLAELRDGNARHVAHRYLHPHESAERQRQLVSGQNPHAEILSCSDSRVPPELIFDQGLGDLFVVRVAGNVASDTELASLEYGAEHLHVP